MNNNTKIILGLGVTGVIAYLILKPKSLPVKVNKTSEEDYKNANAKIAKKIQPKPKKISDPIDYFIHLGKGAANQMIQGTSLEKPKNWLQRLFS